MQFFGYRSRKVNADTLVNIAILLTCAIVISAIVQQRSRASALVRMNQPFKVGAKAETLPEVRYGEARATLVLYLNSGCQFCTASLPFYRELAALVSKDGSVKLVAVSSEPKSPLVQYLDQNHVRVDKAVNFEGRPVPTPTVALVDKSGVLAGVWVGKQSPEGEEAIRASLAKVTSPN